MKKKMVEIEYEKMVIDIPKNTKGVIVTAIAENSIGTLEMTTKKYGTQDIIKRKFWKWRYFK